MKLYDDNFTHEQICTTTEPLLLAECSTHKAIAQNGKIEISLKGFKDGDFEIKPERLYTILAEDHEDLLPLFDRFEETNRINMAEFTDAMN